MANCYNFNIAGTIKAFKDCWIIGDHFVNDIYYVLQELNQEQYKKDKKKIYMYDKYNVKCFSSHPLTKIKEALARLVNALIHGLNEQRDNNTEIPKEKVISAFLPRYILVIPDWDIVKHIGHYQYGVSLIAQKVIHWIVSNMTKAVQSRKDDLEREKIGATHHSEPKIIWLAMINRPGCIDRALSV